MDVNIENIKKICSLAIAFVKEHPQILKKAGFGLILVVLSLVASLVLVFSSCSSHHYFSINAEEITNPSIMYSDSTNLQNPF